MYTKPIGKQMKLFHYQGRQDKIPICHAYTHADENFVHISRPSHHNESTSISPTQLENVPVVSAQLLGEILLLSNPSKTPALGKASVSKAAPSTVAFERSGSAVACKRISPRSVHPPPKNIPPIPANPFTMGINGFIVFMIMPIYL